MANKESWIREVEEKLQAILFRAYVTKETNAAMLFRTMCEDARLLRVELKKAYDLLVDDTIKKG